MSLRTVLGTLTICVGTTMIVMLAFLFPKRESDDTTVEVLMALWIKVPMVIWVVTNTVAWVGLEVLRRKLSLREKVAWELSIENEEAATRAASIKRWRGVVFGSTSAILGSQSTLFMKSLSELCVPAPSCPRPFTY